MIDEQRLVRPDYVVADFFPGLEVNGDLYLSVEDDPVVLIDPIYLADVYRSRDSDAAFVRQHGVFIEDFGGDTDACVILTPDLLVLPVCIHCEGLAEPEIVNGDWIKASALPCDSGSLVLLKVARSLPQSIREKIESESRAGNGVVLDMRPGRWELFFEQHDAPEPRLRGLYRNIVLKRS